MNFKAYAYRITHQSFEIVIMFDNGNRELQLFYKTSRMKYFRPLMENDKKDWLTFPASCLHEAVCAANEAAEGMIFDYERPHK